jgi:hypothetical protein
MIAGIFIAAAITASPTPQPAQANYFPMRCLTAGISFKADPATVNKDTVYIKYGTHKLEGYAYYDAPRDKIGYCLKSDFVSGQLYTFYATTSVTSVDGDHPAKPIAYQFRLKATKGVK